MRHQPPQDRPRRITVKLLMRDRPHQRRIQLAPLHHRRARPDPLDEPGELGLHGNQVSDILHVYLPVRITEAYAPRRRPNEYENKTVATRMRPPRQPPDAEKAEANRVSASLAGLAAALLFVVLGLTVIHHLHDEARVEDCLMSGRNNCDQLVSR